MQSDKNKRGNSHYILFKIQSGLKKATLYLFVVAILLPLLPYGDANAVTTSSGGGGTATPQVITPDQEATSYSYYVALGGCIQNDMYGDFSTQPAEGEDAPPSEWFNTKELGHPNTEGYLYPGGTLTQCVDIATQALQLWGWGSSYGAFLRAIDYKYNANVNSGTPQYHGTADSNTRLRNFQNAVQTMAYNGKAPTLSAPAKYDLYVNALTGSGSPCKANDLGLYSSLKAPINQYVDKGTSNNGLTYTHLSVVDGSNVVTDHGYTYVSSTNSQVINGTQTGTSTVTDPTIATLYGYQNSPSTQTCVQLVKGVNANATTYANFLKATGIEDTASSTSNKCTGGSATSQSGSSCQTDKGGSSCSVDGIGWIICPIANAMAGMADWAFTVVAAFMNVDPLQFSGAEYKSWATMRNIANIAFVIAFLLIIYSQITGGGLSNYSLKKMLPRLIIAAILVNLSYYICAIAVDISNILGYSIQYVFSGVSHNMAPPVSSADSWGSTVTTILAASGAAVVGGVAFSALSSTTVLGALVGLLPLLIAALFALVVAFLVLLARQALIIMMIVIAPLAFVAYLLPNTEDWFQKWRKFFTTLLVLFPVMSVIFGGSQLAAVILRESSKKLMSSPDAGTSMTGFFMYVGSLAVQAIPFFLTPLLIRFSSGVLGKFAGAVNNRNKGVFDKANKWGEQKAKNAQNRGYIRSLQQSGNKRFLGYGARRRARNNVTAGTLEQESRRSETEYISDAVQNSESLQKRMAGVRNDPEALQRVLANSINTQYKLEAEEVTAAQAIIKNANLDLNQMQQLAMGNNATYTDDTGNEHTLIQNSPGSSLQTAAIQNQFKTGDVGMTDALVASSGSMDQQQRQAISEGMQSLSGKVKYYGGLASQNAAQGKINNEEDLNREVASSIEGKKYGEQDLAVQDKDALTRISKVLAKSAADGGASDGSREVLRDIATQLKANDKIYPTVAARNQNRIDAIERGVEYRESTPTPPTP